MEAAPAAYLPLDLICPASASLRIDLRLFPLAYACPPFNFGGHLLTQYPLPTVTQLYLPELICLNMHLGMSRLPLSRHLGELSLNSMRSTLIHQPGQWGRAFVKPFHMQTTMQLNNLALTPFKSKTRYLLKPGLREMSSRAEETTRRSRTIGGFYKLFKYCGFSVISSSVVILVFFIYEANTYSAAQSSDHNFPSKVALSPIHGGPKNLPIADELIGDFDSEIMLAQKDRPRLVVLGTGWGTVALLKSLNAGDYHVTVVSPTNYFLFTPMLPSATVGTLSFRSLVEPVRRNIGRVHGNYLQAEAVDVDFSAKLVEVCQTDAEGNATSFYLPYDKLVVGVGTSSALAHDLCELIMEQGASQIRMGSKDSSTVTF